MTPELVQVWVIQDTRSGNFLDRHCDHIQSLKRAGRIFSAEEARDTAICQLGYDYELHTFWEPNE